MTRLDRSITRAERDKRIIAAVNAGESRKEVAAKYNLGRGCVGQIVRANLAKKAAPPQAVEVAHAGAGYIAKGVK